MRNSSNQGARATRSASIRSMVLLAMFTAIIILMAFTPIGYIDLPIIKATLIHVPVIVGAVLRAPKRARSWASCSGSPA